MTMETVGLDQLGRMLAQLGDKAQEIASGALYDGAGIVANAMNAAVQSIQTEPFKYAADGKMRLASPQEKAALERKIGIAKFRKSGSEVDTMIGISGKSGYTQIAGKKKAVRVIARSINSGTSFMKKQPVFRKAKTQSQGPAKEAIVAKAEKMINEIING